MFDYIAGRPAAPAKHLRGSALVLTGEARNRWLHGIAKRKSETIGSMRSPQTRRLSPTLRTVESA